MMLNLKMLSGILLCAAILLLMGSTMEVEGETGDHHINLKADDVFSPETTSDSDAEPERNRVIADYDSIGVILTNRRYVDVGEWESDPLEADMTLEGPILHNLWFMEVSSTSGGDNNPDWKFEFRHNGENVSFIEIEGTDSSDESPIEIFAVSNLSDPIEALAGDTFGIYIQYKGWEDIDVYYDTQQYDSGSGAEMDSLHVLDICAFEETVEIEVFDAFGSSWSEIGSFTEIEVRGNQSDVEDFEIEEGDQYNVNGDDVTATKLSLTIRASCRGGDSVEGSISYSPGGDTISRSCEADGERPNEQATAEITSISPHEVYIGDQVTFDGSGSYDEDGTIELYLWRSNLDGELYRGSEEVFISDDLTAGGHEITLKVKDDHGSWSEEEAEDLIVNENSPPVIDLVDPVHESLLPNDPVVLSWTAEDDDGDDLVFDVYLGVSENDMDLIAESIEEMEYDSGILEPGISYVWKVIVSDGMVERESAVWSFTMEQEPENTPPEISLRFPAQGQIIELMQVNLLWDGEDDDDDDLTYEIYFGSEPSTLTMVADKVEAQTYPILMLIPGETYYWKIVVSDEKETSESETWSFTPQSGESDGGNGDSDDEWYQTITDEPVYAGGIVVGIIVVIVAVLFIMEWRQQRSDEWYSSSSDYEDDWDW